MYTFSIIIAVRVAVYILRPVACQTSTTLGQQMINIVCIWFENLKLKAGIELRFSIWKSRWLQRKISAVW